MLIGARNRYPFDKYIDCKFVKLNIAIVSVVSEIFTFSMIL